jgi:hypothetical protein
MPVVGEKRSMADIANSDDFQHLPEVPDHKMLRRIGGGSYGEVWLARNVMGTCRAVKVVFRKRFHFESPYEREFTGIRNIEPISRSHEGLVDILQIGRDDSAGYFYYVMELADDQHAGQKIDPATYAPRTLQHEIENRGRLPLDECLQLGLSLTHALGHLHHHGLIHRDIKPSNIIFVGGIPKLADIGLVTDAGVLATAVGTPGFIPPEGPGTPQADLFSLGKVLYAITMGKDPRDFPDPVSDLTALPDRERWLRMNALILKACRSGASQRYQSAAQMSRDLIALQRGRGTQRFQRLILPGACAILVAGVAGVIVHSRNGANSPSPQTAGVVAQSAVPMNSMTEEEAAAGFKLLFNGRDLSGWAATGLNWEAKDGAIFRLGRGGDIEYRSEAVPSDFELRFEWRIASGSDSGVYYRPGEYEYKVVDNQHPGFLKDARGLAAALYDCVGPQKDMTKPVGEWNEGAIVCRGTSIEHWLNGEKAVALDYAKPEWAPIIEEFQKRQRTDLAARGRFLTLKDRQGPVWYRNIRLRKLD